MLQIILLTQIISVVILTLFFFQKKGNLEKSETIDIVLWTSLLSFLNYVVICSMFFEISSLNLLLVASLNGLGTIFFIIGKKYVKLN